jgi:uncharacterized oligopeptide transporter (OPT) family protein
MPKSSGYTAIAFGAFAALLVFAKQRFLKPEHHVYVPNMNAVGIALILNPTTYSFSIAMGATFAYLWQKQHPHNFGMYCYAVAAEMIAGEGLGGVVGAVLQVAKVSGNYCGTAVGCSAMAYCG